MAAFAETLPDFYGPFLPPEQVNFQPHPPEGSSELMLTLGDFLLRVSDCPAIELAGHRRFILNALLHEPDGLATNADLFTAGYHLQASSASSRQVSLSKNTSGLLADLNVKGYTVVDKGVSSSGRLVLGLSSTLVIARAPDDTLGVVRGTREYGVVVQSKLRGQEALNAAVRAHVINGGPEVIYGTSPSDVDAAKKALRRVFDEIADSVEAQERFAKESRILAARQNGSAQQRETGFATHHSGYSKKFLESIRTDH